MRVAPVTAPTRHQRVRVAPLNHCSKKICWPARTAGVIGLTRSRLGSLADLRCQKARSSQARLRTILSFPSPRVGSGCRMNSTDAKQKLANLWRCSHRDFNFSWSRSPRGVAPLTQACPHVKNARAARVTVCYFLNLHCRACFCRSTV